MEGISPELRIVIAGGGIAGLTLARLCVRAGFEPIVLERRALEHMLSGPGGIFIQANAMSVFRSGDGALAERMMAEGGRVLAGGFYTQAGRALYINRPRFVEREDLGVCLQRSRLQELLYEGLPQATVRTGVGVDNYRELPEGVLVTTSAGDQIEADLLVGADGLHSRVRARASGLSAMPPPEYAGFTCWRATFDGSAVSLPSDHSWGEQWGRGARIGWFAVGGGRYALYAFHSRPAGEREPAHERIETLRALFGDFAAPVPAILASLADEPIHRDDIHDRAPPSATWAHGHVTLIGDAAHPVQPNIGQGACQGIEDAFELIQALRRARAPLPDVLRAFEASRTPRVTRVHKVSRQIGQLGQAHSRFAVFARNALYRLTPVWMGDLQFKWLFDYEARWDTAA